MRRLLFSTLFFLTFSIVVLGQSIEIGLRDNLYAHAYYRSAKGFLAGYEQSLLNTRLKEQSGRVFAGYMFDKEVWSIGGAAYLGTEYSGSWQSFGAYLEGLYRPNGFYVDAIVTPHYDTGFCFIVCYQVEAGFSLFSRQENNYSLELCASYGNVPEYRQAIDLLRTGLKFSSGNLWVKPMLCIPRLANNSGQKYLRVLCSFGWSLQL